MKMMMHIMINGMMTVTVIKPHIMLDKWGLTQKISNLRLRKK